MSTSDVNVNTAALDSQYCRPNPTNQFRVLLPTPLTTLNPNKTRNVVVAGRSRAAVDIARIWRQTVVIDFLHCIGLRYAEISKPKPFTVTFTQGHRPGLGQCKSFSFTCELHLQYPSIINMGGFTCQSHSSYLSIISVSSFTCQSHSRLPVNHLGE